MTSCDKFHFVLFEHFSQLWLLYLSSSIFLAVKLLFSWDAQLDILWAGDALQSRYCTLSDQKTVFRRQPGPRSCFTIIWNSGNKTDRLFDGLDMNGIKTMPSSSKWKDMLDRTGHRQKLFLWTGREWNTKYVFYKHIRSFLLNVTLVWLLSPLGSRTLLGS